MTRQSNVVLANEKVTVHRMKNSELNELLIEVKKEMIDGDALVREMCRRDLQCDIALRSELIDERNELFIHRKRDQRWT